MSFYWLNTLDGFNKIDNLIDRVKELGMNAVAITDHGNLTEAFTFNKKCHEANIKPILGIEAYYTHDRHIISLPLKDRENMAIQKVERDINEKLQDLFSDLKDENNIEKEIKKYKKDNKINKDYYKKESKKYMYDTKGYHLILLAKNQIGWNNLVKLTSSSYEDGFFNGNGHVDLELLKQYSEGLICTSACISSVIAHNLRNDNFEEAEKHAIALKEIFGNDFYLEIQPLDWIEQYKVNLGLIELSDKHDIKLVASTDSHYTFKDDYMAHDVLVCIGTKKSVTDENRMKYSHEFWIKDYNEMIEGFELQDGNNKYMEKAKEALENTNEIAAKIEDNIKLGSDTELLPQIEVPKGYVPETWIRHQCWQKLYKYLNKNNLQHKRIVYEARLNHELNVIIKKGFSSYILIVQDAIKFGDENGCPFGPGRGSGAGSLVLFLLGIVKGTDPVEYNLLFSRFLTMDRMLCPDIDSDICKVNRQKLLQYLSNKYGSSNVCQVGTVTKLKVKNGIKDVAKAFDIPFVESNQITKIIQTQISDDPDLTFKKIDDLKEDNPQAYKVWLGIENKYPEIIKYARLLEGTNRNEGIHAGGVLITPTPINDTFPTRLAVDKNTKEIKIVTMWDKDIVEEAKGVKYDFLGLATVSIISQALKFIKENYDIDITLQELYENTNIRNDENVFDMLKAQKSEGVFQCESNLFKSLMRDIQPDDINDLIAITSIARPGPLSANMHTKYANRKKGIEEAIAPLGLDELLKDTYGTLIYQEQVMKMGQIIAGFDDNQADAYLRKALAKKKKDKLELCKQWLIYGKINKEPPEGYDYNNKDQVYYDHKTKHGSEIKGALNDKYKLKDLLSFWEDLQGYCSYLFNKSHATSYSLLSCITAYLKYYYAKEFFCACMSVAGDDEDINSYVTLLNKEYNIKTSTPDINESEIYFKPLKDEDEVLYGFGSIKGVGAKILDEIINNKPYSSLENFLSKFSKSQVNKKTAEALILSGCFDKIENCNNRYIILNKFYELRDQSEHKIDVYKWNKLTCMQEEIDKLNISLTYKTWIDELDVGDKTTVTCSIKSKTEKIDKNGRLMAFVTVVYDYCEVEVLVFATKYKKFLDIFDTIINKNKIINMKCKKLESNKVEFITGSIA